MKYFVYERISTEEERLNQKFSRQDHAIKKYLTSNSIPIEDVVFYKDQSTGSNFDRPAWQKLEKDMTDIVKNQLTIIFTDVSRFTRETENGLAKYLELYNLGVNLVFINNYVLNTDYVKSQEKHAEKMKAFSEKFMLDVMIRLSLILEIERCEKERQVLIERIKQGIEASEKKQGRPLGHLDKLTPSLKKDIEEYFQNRDITMMSLAKKHHIAYNTIFKYVKLAKKEREQQQNNSDRFANAEEVNL